MTDQIPQPLDNQTQGRFARLDTVIDGRSVRFWIVVAIAITAVVLGFGALWTYVLDRDTQMSTTTGMGNAQMVDARAVVFPPWCTVSTTEKTFSSSTRTARFSLKRPVSS